MVRRGACGGCKLLASYVESYEPGGEQRYEVENVRCKVVTKAKFQKNHVIRLTCRHNLSLRLAPLFAGYLWPAPELQRLKSIVL